MSVPAYASRREALLAQMGTDVLVIASAPVAIRNHDVEHSYRQDSDFYYLSGFDEPHSVLVLTNVHKEHRFVLFVRPRDPERETWDGPRAGLDGAKAQFGADAAFDISELGKQLPEYLQGAATLHYRVGQQSDFDRILFDMLKALRARMRTGVRAPRTIADPGLLLHEMRLRKSEAEVLTMRKAASITREAHMRAIEIARPGRFEYEVEAEMARVFRAHGCERPAYDFIVGSGPNATILHYRKNDRQLKDNDLLLIDAGCEYAYYASDVTRTFPVSGRFTAPQRALYEIVLAAHDAALRRIRPGVTLQSLHDTALHVIVEGLVRVGLLEGSVDDALEKETYKAYFMHRTSHWLGMDVHDVGEYFEQDGSPRRLESGFVLTVEPGIYVSSSAAVDSKWRGIGIRIEDDLLVTDTGFSNLTGDVPREAEELEKLLARRGPAVV